MTEEQKNFKKNFEKAFFDGKEIPDTIYSFALLAFFISVANKMASILLGGSNNANK